MTAQVEVAKLNAYFRLGEDSGSISVPKLNMYARLVPGAGDTATGQGFCYSQKIRRD